MGCGSSGQVITPETSNGHKMTNGKNTNGHDTHHKHDDKKHHHDDNHHHHDENHHHHDDKNHHHDDDDLPTVVLPDTPVKPKPPIAYEIPLEEFDSSYKPHSPPAHLQRLLQTQAPEISLPDIQEKLAEAEQRRQAILQQRAASAQKRTQKIMKNLQDEDQLENEYDDTDATKHATNSVTMTPPPEPGMCDDKYFS